MYKKYFSKFLTANEGKLHFACHSHHYWPDCTRDAHIQYWDDSAKMVDDKWGHIFGEKLQAVQKQICEILNIQEYAQLTFASNTHELAYRVLSCFYGQKKIKILTTDSEFYSFDRQVNRLVESGFVEVTKVPLQPYETFPERFSKQSQEQDYDITFFSHVFFNSAYAVENLTNFVEGLNQNSTIIIDSYHGFMALPTDLSQLEGKVFYLGGGYKYAAAGEGACFLISPKSFKLNPVNTGWFAQLGNLSNASSDSVKFSTDGYRFAGSTQDFSALYRMNAVFDLYKNEGITVEKIHHHVVSKQKLFLEKIKDTCWFACLKTPLNSHGHFLAFELKSAHKCEEIHNKLKEKGIETDYRKNIIRFGFSMYHDDSDIEQLAKKVVSLDV
jgi:selenocysteine lyase/cysteine desulfurase